jgi:hypothetical protein
MLQHGCFTRVGGWDASVGRSFSIYIKSRILIANPLAGKAGPKKDLSMTNFYTLANVVFF